MYITVRDGCYSMLELAFGFSSRHKEFSRQAKAEGVQGTCLAQSVEQVTLDRGVVMSTLTMLKIFFTWKRFFKCIWGKMLTRWKSLPMYHWIKNIKCYIRN